MSLLSMAKVRMSNFTKILFIVLSATLSACATIKEITIPQTIPTPIEKSGIATAGAISIDITPPPGLPMGGYSVMANIGQGFRTRLKARVIYLNDGKGNSTVLVQTDLTAASLLMHHKVASAVAKATGLRPGDIAITASHSHSAPANIFNNDFYNKHMSSGKGLEEEFLKFSVTQISKGIIEAYNIRRPAKIAIGSKNIYGYNRNRSISAYALNSDINPIDINDQNSVFKAVNPALTMIRIDVKDKSNQYYPLAAFSSFSVHATAITPQVEVYNADLFAYAQKDLEWSIKRAHNTPWPVVHALTTGTQGDMAPALELQGDNYIRHFDLNWKQAKKLGQSIGKEAIKLFESLQSKLSPDISLMNVARELNIRNNNKIGDISLCKDAAIGSPTVGGAYERRTPWLSTLPFFNTDSIFSHRWLFTDGCHGNKNHVGFAYIQPIFEPKDSFPQIVMFQLIKINDALIIPLPFEVTINAGKQISSTIMTTYNNANTKPVEYVWITSNANGYFGYTTTVDEYARQNYEGGHTLYGKYSTPYLAEQLSDLVFNSKSNPAIHELLPNWQYKVAVNQFLPKKQNSSGTRQIIQQPEVVEAKNLHDEHYVAFQWQDINPSEIDFHKPLGKIELLQSGNWLPLQVKNEPINDEGYDIEIRYLTDLGNDMGKYEIRWYNPAIGHNYRFVIEPRKKQTRLISRAFSYFPIKENKHDLMVYK